jgi:ketosteroid isomerase-like protein
MSQNLETVKQIYAAFGRGDIPAILNTLADNVAWEAWADNSAARAGVPWLIPRHGKAGAADFFALIGPTLVVTHFRVLSLMDGGDQVAAEFEIACDVPSTGGHYRDEEMHLWTFDASGKVLRLRHYTDTAKHIRAANVRDSPEDAVRVVA